MAGYDAYSKSNNAVDAEMRGLLPLTRAICEVARVACCTQKKARAALQHIGPSEWHHSSKYYNCVDYYEVEAAVKYLAVKNSCIHWPQGWQKRFGQQWQSGNTSARHIAAQKMAIEFGTTAEAVIDAYYAN